MKLYTPMNTATCKRCTFSFCKFETESRLLPLELLLHSNYTGNCCCCSCLRLPARQAARRNGCHGVTRVLQIEDICCATTEGLRDFAARQELCEVFAMEAQFVFVRERKRAQQVQPDAQGKRNNNCLCLECRGPTLQQANKVSIVSSSS